MNRLVITGALLFLSACGVREDAIRQHDEYNVKKQRYDFIKSEIKQHGFVVVGTTPDGRKLYMKEISVGYETDRVYFTEGSKVSTVSREACGKNCTTNTVTIQ